MSKLKSPKIEVVALSKLKPWQKNPRTRHAVDAIARSIEEFGYLAPIIVQAGTYRILAGHGRLEALKKRGEKTVPVVVANITDRQADLYTIADNKLTEMAEWEFSKLAGILATFENEKIDASITGFNADEIKQIVNWAPTDDREEAEPPPEPPAKPVSKTGDLWELGRHRLFCGDSTKEEDVARLMGDERAGLMNTDPPYGVGYANDDRPNPGVAKPRVAKDEFRDEELQSFLESAFRVAVSKALKINAAWYLWHAHLTQGFFAAAAAAAAAAAVILHRQIIWVKPVLLLTRGQYHWKHEPCFMGWVQGHQPPDYGRGAGERDQTTVWEVPSIPIAERKELNHSTPKPTGLFELPMVKHLKPGEICFEPFAGSGPQIIAAEKLGRRCYGLELEPQFVDVCVKRWQNFTKQKARNLTRKGVEID